jgi:DNA repair protein NreA
MVILMMSANLCIQCKGGRMLCGNNPCPLLAKISVKPRIDRSVSKEYFGPSFNIFVGREGYPNVNMGPLVGLDNSKDMDNPNSWFGREYSDLVEMRSMVLRSKQVEGIKSRSKFVEINQELALASKPADVELFFKHEPVYRFSFSDVTQPMGPSAQVEKAILAENPRISKKVESVVSDELKSSDQAGILYDKGIDIYKITTILSSGILGLDRNKKMVPTRWSITATDDILAKKLISEIKQLESVNEYIVYHSEYLHNRFTVLIMPGSWEFENFEAWAPGSFWASQIKDTAITEEYESYKGRKGYADLQGGGYYASRISMLEGLKKIGRQGRVFVI